MIYYYGGFIIFDMCVMKVWKGCYVFISFVYFG